MLTIKIPLPEKVSTNQIYAGKHWAVRKKLADLYHESLIEYRNKRITDYPAEITFIFTYKNKPLDCLNTSYSAKLLEDGLRKWEIIEDDNPDFISSVTLISKKGTIDEVEIIIV